MPVTRLRLTLFTAVMLLVVLALTMRSIDVSGEQTSLAAVVDVPVPKAEVASLAASAEETIAAAAAAETAAPTPSAAAPAPQPPTLRNKDIAIVTYVIRVEGDGQSHFTFDKFAQLLNVTMESLKAYSHRHAHPFFFANNALLRTDRYAAYWSKMGVVKHYLQVGGFEWVLWTDVDVLITRPELPLTEFLSRATADQHVMTVLECRQTEGQYGAARSGFFAVRNSPEGIEFLDVWAGMFDEYKDHWNPEQEALEKLLETEYWQQRTLTLLPEEIHTYPSCYDLPFIAPDNRSFSLHFVADSKGKAPEWAERFNVSVPTNDFRIAI